MKITLDTGYRPGLTRVLLLREGNLELDLRLNQEIYDATVDELVQELVEPYLRKLVQEAEPDAGMDFPADEEVPA